MTYKEAIDYLFNSAPLFQNIGAGAYKEGLQNTIALDNHFGNPHKRFKTIHIGGTNGKGSCSHTIAAVLQCAGYKVGLYTSPHLVDFRERIRVNGKMISKEEVIKFVTEERSFFEPLYPSFFELTTAMAFNYFAKQGVDVAVIEVGLGGRFDCTNIIEPEISVITNISFDHVQLLGDSLTKIAKEKAGIIKKQVPIIVGEVVEETREVFLSKANEMRAPIRFACEERPILGVDKIEPNIYYKTSQYGIIKSVLTGKCQEHNAATILTVVDELIKQGFLIYKEHILKAFSDVCILTGLRGRWHKVCEKPEIICDTGHNVDGISYISEQLKEYKNRHIRIVLGMVNDKDVSTALSLMPSNATYYFTKASVKRALNEFKLATLGLKFGLKGKSYSNVRHAFDSALNDSTFNDVIFIGGSTFVVADFLSFFEEEK